MTGISILAMRFALIVVGGLFMESPVCAACRVVLLRFYFLLAKGSQGHFKGATAQ